MKKILVNDHEILLDDDIYELFKNEKIRISNTGYAFYNGTPLSKIILKTKERIIFKNKNRLDLRRKNLKFSVRNYYENKCLYVLHENSYIRVKIDSEDIDKLKKYTWLVYDNRYLRAKILGKNVSIHRYILDYTGNETVDHIDRNIYNNQKSNLRIISYTENVLNRGVDPRNKMGLKGIIKTKTGFSVKFQKYGIIKRKTFSFKNFKSIEEALSKAVEYRQYLEETM